MPVSSNSSDVVLRRHVPVGDRRQRLDLDLDQPDRVLGDAGAVGQHHRDRLADIAHLRLGDHRLHEGLEIRQRLQPERDARDRLPMSLAVITAVHAREARAPARCRSSGCAHAPPSCAGSPHAARSGAREIVDVLAAAAQEAQVLEALDRAADERVLHA